MDNWTIQQEFSTTGCITEDDYFFKCDCKCDDFTPFLPLPNMNCGIGIYMCTFSLKSSQKGRGLYLITPDDIQSFHYQDDEIVANLNMFVTDDYNCYHRKMNGFISGEKIDGVWKINFDIQYGKKNKFRIKR